MPKTSIFACVLLFAMHVHTLAATLDNEPPLAATAATQAANKSVESRLPLQHTDDFTDATRGLIATIEGGKIVRSDAQLSVDVNINDYVEGPAPDTVNPSLWRQSKLNKIHGLFEVVDGVYQVRGYDVAVMTLIAGTTGWIVVDPLMSAAPVRAGLALANEHLGKRPVSAILFTHSHQDHFGGVRGAMETAGDGEDVTIVAPAGFLREVVSEHLLAGPLMNRRSVYQGGFTLQPGPQGWMGLGLAQVIARGGRDLVPPTRAVAPGGEDFAIDGVPFAFIDASGTEATAEFVFYLPQHKVLHSAEVVTGAQHNVLAPRGAKVRDTLRWSEVIDAMLARFGGDAVALVGSHHGPVFGNTRVQQKLRNHRNLYRYLHDQTLRRANLGLTMHEIADDLPEPALMQTDFSTRGYYGFFKHNVRAVYQSYFGWWDGVPANLDPLAPEQAAKKYVEFMGGTDAVLKKAIASFEQGEYRWAATVLNHVVFADPANQNARRWLAACYRQLGFQQESAIFRNVYLSGASELLNPRRSPRSAVAHNKTLSLYHQGNLLALRFNPDKFHHAPLTINFEFVGTEEELSLDVDKDVLFPRPKRMNNADYNVEITKTEWHALVAGGVSATELSNDGGAVAAIDSIFAALDTFDLTFNIVEP